MKPIAYRPYQLDALRFVSEHERCNLFAGMGMGKTLVGLSLVRNLDLLGQLDRPALVVGPLRVARDTWPNELRKWQEFKGMEVAPIVGDRNTRLRALQRLRPIYTTNYEQLPWLVEHFGPKWPFGMVIADESTKLKGFRMKGQGTQRSTAIARVAHTGVKRWINLTGTPAPNGLLDLWGQCWFIDRGLRLGTTFGAFKDRWFAPTYDGGDRALPHAQEQIGEAIRDVSLTLDPHDYFDLTAPRVVRVPVRLPPKARKAYDELENELFTQLESGHKIEAMNSASVVNKTMQAANGALYAPHPEWVPLHDEKLAALESIVNESGVDKLLVSYQFQSDRDRILKAWGADAVDISTPKGFKAFMEGAPRLGVSHPKSMGHGVDGIQNICWTVVRFGHDWNLEDRQQMVERVGPVRQAQIGHADRLVTIYDIVAEDSIDDIILARHETKRSVQELLLEACKRRK